MSVGPVQHSPNVVDAQESANQVRPAQPRGSSSGNQPVREVAKPQSFSPVPPIVEDEVKLQWDSSDGVRIYQFVDQKSGVLILQIPSEEVLKVGRGIQESLQESLQRQALQDGLAQRQSAPLAWAGNKGGKANGD